MMTRNRNVRAKYSRAAVALAASFIALKIFGACGLVRAQATEVAQLPADGPPAAEAALLQAPSQRMAAVDLFTLPRRPTTPPVELPPIPPVPAPPVPSEQCVELDSDHSQTEAAISPDAPAERGILRRKPDQGDITPASAQQPALEPPAPVLSTAEDANQPPLARAFPRMPALMRLPPLTQQRGTRRIEEFPQLDKPLGSLTTNILPSKGELPSNYAAPRFEREGQVFHHAGTSRIWAEELYQWHATAFCHNPLYFEEVNLERSGHSWGLAQPVVSGAHFFARIPILPYLATAYPPFECIHTLGHYHPGSYAPFRYIRPPLRPGAAAVQTGVVIGLVYLIP
jgi:hypothetical protein